MNLWRTDAEQAADNEAFVKPADGVKTDQNSVTMGLRAPEATPKLGRARRVCGLIVVLAVLASVAALTGFNTAEVGRLRAAQLRAQLPESSAFGEFTVNVSGAGPCSDGGSASRQPCWDDGRYVTAERLGPLKPVGEVGADFELATNRTEIRVRRGGVFGVDGAVRLRLDRASAPRRISGQLEINGELDRIACDSGAALTNGSDHFVCRLTAFMKLRAGDRLGLKLHLLSRQQLEVSRLSTVIRVVRLP